MEHLVDLAVLGPDRIADAGGKAVNLGVMIAAGLPTPPGFCVSTGAYRAVVADRLDELFERLAAGGPDLAAVTEHARELVRDAPVPDDLRRDILASYHGLGNDVAVAVRSSATAEDLAYASFAGQQDSYLNMVGDDAVLDAVRRCWASLWTARAVSYRNANGIDHRDVALAVVVQRMVDATIAGVMFTANPVTGARHETVIDASPGLGEAVVSGAVNPDHFVVDSRSGTVVARRAGDKRVAVVSRPGGGTDRVVRDAGDAEPCLNDAQLGELTRLGARVQEHYGAPQDTEWALDADGRFWLTQARPITTLYPQPITRHAGSRLFLCMSLAQGLVRPITPMGLAAFRLIGSSVARLVGRPPADPMQGPAPLAILGQRPFIDLTPVIQHPLGRRLIPAVGRAMEARTAAVLATLVRDPRFPVRRESPHAAARPIARVLVLRAKLPLRMATALVSPRAAHAGIARVERDLRQALTLPANATLEQRIDHVEASLSRDLFLIMPRTFAYPALGLLLKNLARRLLGAHATESELLTVLRGLPHNVTTEMDLELWQATTLIAEDPDSAATFASGDVPALTRAYQERTLPPVAQRTLTAFLRRYGHRAVAEIDLGMPRWAGDPSHIVGVIVNYLRLDDPDLAPPRQFARGRAEAEAMLDHLVARVPDRQQLRRRVVAFALRRARQLVGLRESPKNLLIVTLGLIRAQLEIVGQALAERGALETAEDIFFLELNDVRQALAGQPVRDLVAERRAAYALELRRRHIPRLLLSDGTEPEATLTSAPRPDGALSGSPASPGTVTAPARVVLDPVGARLEPGEILVAPSTDPGWTPLFLTAGGLVMEMGGSMSHGAVVAREYGIPAVVGVPDATQRIETGQQLTVDGAAGLVFSGS